MKIHEDNFARYQGQLLGKYNELNTKLEDHFHSVFKQMQADTRKEFETMQKMFSKKEKKLDEAFQKCKFSACPYVLNYFYEDTWVEWLYQLSLAWKNVRAGV